MANVITLNVYQINNTIQRRGQVLYSSVDFPVILIFAAETDLIISGVQINSIITIGTTNYYVAETTTQIATAANAGGGGASYLVYTALLSQSGTYESQTSGVLVVGKFYWIVGFEAGDDFSNIAEVISGTINSGNCVFRATGTTPASWANGSEICIGSAPTEDVVFSNTLGGSGSMGYIQFSRGEFWLCKKGAFPDDKVYAPSGIAAVNGDITNLMFNWKRLDDDRMQLITYKPDIDKYDDALISTPVEIRVYP